MKKLFIIILLLIAGILISPKFIGEIVEKEYQIALDKINENPAITIQSATFNRGWFSGNAVIKMTVLFHHEEIEDFNIIVEGNLSFGPIVFTDEGLNFALSHSKSSFDFMDLTADKEIEDFIKHKIHISALLTFSRDIITHIAIDEASKEVDGNTIVSTKAFGEFVLENENKLYGDFNWGGLTATTAEENFIIGPVSFSLDQTLVSGSYYQGNAISTGNFDFVLSSIESKDAANTPVLLVNNALISVMSSVENDLMEIKVGYAIDKLESLGQQFANVNLDIVFENLHINVMQDINTFLTSLTDDEAFSSSNMNKISALTASMLENDPVIEVKDLSVETPKGKIASAMQVQVDKKQYDPSNVMSIVAAINATAQGKAPMAFFTHLGLQPMIETYIEQGFLIKNEDEISVNLKYSQGQLNVNGNVMSL